MLLLLSFVMFISLVTSTHVVVHHPIQHQQVISDSYIGVEYDIIKGNDQTVDIKFEWTCRNTTTPPLQLNVHQGFSDRVMTGQQHYSYQWKTPTCPFFIRYQPHHHHFSLLFLIGSNNIIRIPLNFTLVTDCNSKRLDHHHHHHPTDKHQ